MARSNAKAAEALVRVDLVCLVMVLRIGYWAEDVKTRKKARAKESAREMSAFTLVVVRVLSAFLAALSAHSFCQTPL